MNFNIFKPSSSKPSVNPIDFNIIPDVNKDCCAAQNGEDGSSITIVSNTKVGKVTTLVFSDGTSITITDGNDGTNGTNGNDGLDGTDGNDGIDGTNGINGISVINVEIDTNPLNLTYKHLLVYLSDGTTIDAGIAVGSNGINGSNGTNGNDGVSVVSASINSDNELELTLSDTSVTNAGRLSFYNDLNIVDADAGSTNSVSCTLNRTSGKINITNARANSEDYFTVTLNNSFITDTNLIYFAITKPNFSTKNVIIVSQELGVGNVVIKLYNSSVTDTFSGDFELRFAIL